MLWGKRPLDHHFLWGGNLGIDWHMHTAEHKTGVSALWFFYYLPMCRASVSAFKSKALWLISRQSFYTLLTLPSLLTVSHLYSPDTLQWLALETKGQEKLSLRPNIEALTMWTFSTFWWTSHVHSTISYVRNMNGFDCPCDIFDYWNARTPHWCWLATKSLILFTERDTEMSLGPWRCLLSCRTASQEGERPSHTKTMCECQTHS